MAPELHGWSLASGPIGWPIINNPNRTSLEYVDGEVVVDFTEAFKYHPNYNGEAYDESPSHIKVSSKSISSPDLLITWSDSSQSGIVSGSPEIVVTEDNIDNMARDIIYVLQKGQVLETCLRFDDCF